MNTVNGVVSCTIDIIVVSVCQFGHHATVLPAGFGEGHDTTIATYPQHQHGIGHDTTIATQPQHQHGIGHDTTIATHPQHQHGEASQSFKHIT